jgi:hypothetical protein
VATWNHRPDALSHAATTAARSGAPPATLKRSAGVSVHRGSTVRVSLVQGDVDAGAASEGRRESPVPSASSGAAPNTALAPSSGAVARGSLSQPAGKVLLHVMAPKDS